MTKAEIDAIVRKIRVQVRAAAKKREADYFFEEQGHSLVVGISSSEGEWCVWKCNIQEAFDGLELPDAGPLGDLPL